MSVDHFSAVEVVPRIILFLSRRRGDGGEAVGVFAKNQLELAYLCVALFGVAGGDALELEVGAVALDVYVGAWVVELVVAGKVEHAGVAACEGCGREGAYEVHVVGHGVGGAALDSHICEDGIHEVGRGVYLGRSPADEIGLASFDGCDVATFHIYT